MSCRALEAHLMVLLQLAQAVQTLQPFILGKHMVPAVCHASAG